MLAAASAAAAGALGFELTPAQEAHPELKFEAAPACFQSAIASCKLGYLQPGTSICDLFPFFCLSVFLDMRAHTNLNDL